MAAHRGLFCIYLIVWTHVFAPLQASRPSVNIEKSMSTETDTAGAMRGETQHGGAIETGGPSPPPPLPGPSPPSRHQRQISLYAGAKGELITTAGMNNSENETSLVQKEETGYYSQRICAGVMLSWAGAVLPWLRFEKTFKCGLGISVGIGASISYAEAMGELVSKGSHQTELSSEFDPTPPGNTHQLDRQGNIDERTLRAQEAADVCQNECAWSRRGAKIIFVVGGGVNLAGDGGPWFAIVFANIPANPGSAMRCYSCLRGEMGMSGCEPDEMADVTTDNPPAPRDRPNLFMVQLIFSLTGAALTLCKRFSMKGQYSAKLKAWIKGKTGCTKKDDAIDE